MSGVANCKKMFCKLKSSTEAEAKTWTQKQKQTKNKNKTAKRKCLFHTLSPKRKLKVQSSPESQSKSKSKSQSKCRNHRFSEDKYTSIAAAERPPSRTAPPTPATGADEGMRGFKEIYARCFCSRLPAEERRKRVEKMCSIEEIDLSVEMLHVDNSSFDAALPPFCRYPDPEGWHCGLPTGSIIALNQDLRVPLVDILWEDF